MLNEDNLLSLMTIEYWEAVFPGDGMSRVNWTSAKSELKDQCRKKGIFRTRHVRGAGVWNDDGRIVVNMGDHLVVDGRRVGLGEIKSRYFYTLGATLSALHSNPLTVGECRTLIEACQTFKWTKEESGLLLAGALVASRVCGALPVRPHAWITGGAQTGKTTLLERLIKPIMGENKLYVFGNTTEAGIRQELKADAVPVLFDEFETTGQASAEKIALVVDLMRAAWADSGAMIVKGGAGGNASHFQVRFSAIVSSIRTKLINDADKGRFAVLELAPHGGDQEHWNKLNGLLVQIDAEFSERLFARTIRMIPTFLGNFKLLKVALAKTADSRFGDQYGMLLAAYSILIADDPIDASDAEFMAKMVTLEEEREVAKIADHNDALSHLLTTKIQVDRKDYSVRELIGTAWKQVGQVQRPAEGFLIGLEEKKALNRLGIRVENEWIAIVANNHAELERVIWARTNWSKTWGNSLARLPGATKKKIRIGGLNQAAIQIPVDAFDMEST